MNSTPPRFNAPIPEYADLNFLFYRWGYDELGLYGKETFLIDVEQHFKNTGLKLFFDSRRSKYEVMTMRQPGIHFIPAKHFYNLTLEEMLSSELRERAKEQKYMMLSDLEELEYYDSLAECEFIEVALCYVQDSQMVVIDLIKDNHAAVLVLTEETDIDICFKVENKGETLEYSSKEVKVAYKNPALDFKEIAVQKDNLKAFEQKAGFYNHGLTPKQVEHYSALPSEQEKRKKTARGQHLKEYVTPLTTEQIKLTLWAYEEAKKQHPQERTKITRLKTAAEIISKEEGKIIRYKGVEKRLEGVGYFFGN